MKGSKAVAAEFFGTMFLLLVVVGSGMMGESLSQGNAAIALLANSLATGAGLFVLIQCLAPISGAHFNPVVTLLEAMRGRLGRKQLSLYWVAQFAGAIFGVILAHFIFDQPLFQISSHARTGLKLGISEFIATFGLVATIALAGKRHSELAPITIAAYIVGAYWFTSSTSFANPAVTVARMFTDTFCGIAPSGVLTFVLAQIGGGLAAEVALRRLEGRARG